jgi:two-component SAPR family response regulator
MTPIKNTTDFKIKLQKNEKENLFHTMHLKSKSFESEYQYIFEKIFNQQPEQLKDFLVKTSILDVMIPSLCDELLGVNNSKRILKDLMEQNLFLNKLEEDVEHYRYCRLFKEFLMKRLGAEGKILLEKAGSYYFDKSDYKQATRYYLAADVYENPSGTVKPQGERSFEEKELEEIIKKFEGGFKEGLLEGDPGNERGMGQSPVIWVKCFGGFEVFKEGIEQPIKWKTTKAKEIFAYFIQHKGKIIAKGKILEDIWPEMDPEKTSVALHSYIYQVRKVLKTLGLEKILVYKNKGYGLMSETIISDVQQFERLLEESVENEKGKVIHCLEEAVQLYQGEYLEGCYNQWIIEEKQRLEERYILAMKRLAYLYSERKEDHQALKCLNKIIKINPLLEEVHERLMIIYENMGNRIAAIHQYESFYHILEREMGIKPKAEMTLYYNRILKEN